MRQKLISVTAKDCRWVYYNGTGKGGMNRNKTQVCVRCFHDPSGAMGKCEEERSQPQNKIRAFKRMAESKEFQKWLKLESMRLSGELALIEQKVDEEVRKAKVEVKDEEGRWVDFK